MSNQRVLVSFSAPSSFLSSDHWKQIRAALISQLPLRNIHWKSALRPSIRTIQELDITLVALDALRDEHTSQVPVTLLEKPFLHIYIVTCEDTDLDAYRNTVKKQIKDWHTTVTTRKNQEWLILHLVRPDARTPSGNFFQLKGSVLDKMKADFNVEKRERCVQLAWSTLYDNPAAWAELINKIKDGILSAFDSAVSQREEEVKRSESQRQMPGWNFCTFFVLKESLASSFEGVNLFEDALLQYGELEASFYQVLKEKNLSWFGTLISPDLKDDSMPLLSISKKPYRDLILANTISVFDFRIYLLARQCVLLAKVGRLNEVGRKAGSFLGAFGRRLQEVEATIPEYFVQSWIYSSALSVVEQCDTWATGVTLEGPTLAAFNAGKGELLELARNQLDTIGIRVGHLPSRPPFSMKISDAASIQTTPKRSSQRISNPDLLAAMDNRDVFYDRYVDITNRAIDMYARAGRRKFALKLHGSLAALDLHRGRLDAALTTYTSLPAHYAPHMWTSLESFMLSRALDTHSDLAKANDREWVHILLSFLKTYIDNIGMELLMHEEDKVAYISQLVNAMKAAAGELDSDLAHPDHPAMSIQVCSDARLAGTQDGAFLNVTIQNNLPCPLPVDDVTVVLAGRDAERLKFTSPTECLAPGKTDLTLFSPTSSFGTFVLDCSAIRMSRLLFQWAHRKVSSSSKAYQVNKNSSTLVQIPRDLQALDVRLSQPNHIELGTPPNVLVVVSTGRSHISRATIKLSAPSGIKFLCQDAVLDGDGVGELETTNESIVLTDIPKDQTVAFLVPHSDASAFHAMKVDLEVDYITASEPSITRSLRLTRVVVTSLPIAVNVEDFFRGSRLFSKFTISTTSHQHIRISSAQLQGPAENLNGLKIVSCLPQKRGVVTVTPAQPANFLFYLDSTNGHVRESLNLLIKYRMLREEVEILIKNMAEKVLANSASLLHRDALVDMVVAALELDARWVEMYGITGELNVPGPPAEGELGDPLIQVKKLLSEHRHPYPPIGEWREIKIPVDVPYMSIIAAAQIRILSTPFAADTTPGQIPSLYAGQPISALLTVHTSFHWGSSANNKECSYKMRFDVEEMVRDWLVSGRKRGDFIAMDGATYSMPITLIALHHGELALPKVAVAALSLPGEVTMRSMAIPSTETYQIHGAEKVLVLPRGGRSTFVVGMGSS